MESKKVEITLKNKLGSSFFKGGDKRKPSFVSMARSVNLTIGYLESNEPDKLQAYLDGISECLEPTEEIILNLHGKVKQELDSLKIVDNNQLEEKCIIEFSLEDTYILRIIRLGLKADELFSMLEICRKSDKIFIDRSYLAEHYQKPVIDSLKQTLAGLMNIETDSRKNRQGGLYE